MPFCGSCGAQVEGKFCAKCGAVVGAGASASTPPPAGSYASPVAGAMQDNVASALCYLLGLITGIIFLVMEPYSKNRAIRFHAFQSIFLNVAVFVVEIVLGIVFRIMLEIFGFFGLLTGVFWPILWLAFVALWLYLMFSAYQGKTVLLPVIGPLAQKQAQS